MEPSIYEWQVSPFGTTCSPCCAIFTLQHHVQGCRGGLAELGDIVENSFYMIYRIYVDNCLYSTPNPDDAKRVVDGLHQLLASNVPSMIQHLSFSGLVCEQ